MTTDFNQIVNQFIIVFKEEHEPDNPSCLGVLAFYPLDTIATWHFFDDLNTEYILHGTLKECIVKVASDHIKYPLVAYYRYMKLYPEQIEYIDHDKDRKLEVLRKSFLRIENKREKLVDREQKIQRLLEQGI